jgi:hypothetical protein
LQEAISSDISIFEILEEITEKPWMMESAIILPNLSLTGKQASFQALGSGIGWKNSPEEASPKPQRRCTSRPKRWNRYVKKQCQRVMSAPQTLVGN